MKPLKYRSWSEMSAARRWVTGICLAIGLFLPPLLVAMGDSPAILAVTLLSAIMLAGISRSGQK